jgi:hypothetical protein
MLRRLNDGRLRRIHDNLHLYVLVGVRQDTREPLGGNLQFFMGAIVLMVVSGVITHVELLLRAEIFIILIAIFFVLGLEGYLGWRNEYLFEFVDSGSVVGVGNSLAAAFATTFSLVLFGVAHL